MTQEITEAKRIYIPTTAADQLSLETNKYLASGEQASYIDFYLCDSNLCFKKESQSPVVLTSDSVKIEDLTFTRIVTGGKSAVRINFKASYVNPGNFPEYKASFAITLTSTASLRY